ncbi:MAG: hypothetical protein L0H59_04910 [Tomitella sp.]|nr:hypothetical protein [Tomitella sp.]
MRGQVIGSLIAAAFGLVYVVVNSWPLPSAVTWAVRVCAIVLFVAIATLAVTASLLPSRAAPAAETASPSQLDHAPTDSAHPRTVFTRGYWLVVGAEVVALFGGLAVINNLLHAPHAGVAWVSVVVGVHFFALARVFRLGFFDLLGAMVAACGAVGLVLAAIDGSGGATAAVAGVVPGFILLGFGLWGMRSRPPRPAPHPVEGTPPHA